MKNLEKKIFRNLGMTLVEVVISMGIASGILYYISHGMLQSQMTSIENNAHYELVENDFLLKKFFGESFDCVNTFSALNLATMKQIGGKNYPFYNIDALKSSDNKNIGKSGGNRIFYSQFDIQQFKLVRQRDIPIPGNGLSQIYSDSKKEVYEGFLYLELMPKNVALAKKGSKKTNYFRILFDYNKTTQRIDSCAFNQSQYLLLVDTCKNVFHLTYNGTNCVDGSGNTFF